MNIEFKIIFYKKQNGRIPLLEYLDALPGKDRDKILACIDKLRIHDDFRKEPFSRHLRGKLRELKINFWNSRYRVIYFLQIGKIIVVLSAFMKKTNKTPVKELKKAEEYYNDFLRNINNNHYEN